MSYVWQALAVFTSAAVLDFVWAKYNTACADRRATPASTYAALIMLIGGLNVVLYTEHTWLLGAAAAGAFVGTWASLKHAP